MNGMLAIDDGTLYDLLEVVARNMGNVGSQGWISLLGRISGGLKQYNPLAKARRNVAHATVRRAFGELSLTVPVRCVFGRTILPSNSLRSGHHTPTRARYSGGGNWPVAMAPRRLPPCSRKRPSHTAAGTTGMCQ